MKRDIYSQLVAWKESARRKPLLMRGARQTGKTFILKAFGQAEYEKMHYLNFEAEPELRSLFERDLKPDRVLRDLRLLRGEPIIPEKHLIVFDEVQASNSALNSLKYFNEEANEYHVAAAGSLLGVELSKPGSFPVGNVALLDIYPMTFFEFLDAVGRGGHRDYLEALDGVAPLPDAFHQELIAHLRNYYVTGGMPEAVRTFVETDDFQKVREAQRDILNSYVLDFAKHTPSSDIPKMTHIWESLPVQLARENKRFLFSAAKEGARAREYEDALIWLERAGLIRRSFAVETPRLPLKACSDRRLFKVYMLDVGLLGALSHLATGTLLAGDAAFREYHGAFVENYVAQAIVSLGHGELYYWRNPRSTAEVDFLCEFAAGIVPLEVKAGINPRSKSLAALSQAHGLNRLFRATLQNLRTDGQVTNVPLYAIQLLERFVSLPC